MSKKSDFEKIGNFVSSKNAGRNISGDRAGQYGANVSHQSDSYKNDDSDVVYRGSGDGDGVRSQPPIWGTVLVSYCIAWAILAIAQIAQEIPPSLLQVIGGSTIPALVLMIPIYAVLNFFNNLFG